MKEAEDIALKRFETRVRDLIEQYKKLQEEHFQLLLDCEEKDKQLEACKAEVKNLGDDFAKLKLAQMMKISNEDLAEAKARVDRLVRKVDKCIALLGV